MRNLLENTEDRIFFKDRESRFLLVSKGFDSALPEGRSSDGLIGKTDFDIFSDPHAVAAFEDERRVIDTGEPMIGRVERETFDDRPDVWVSTTKLPLRDDDGTIIGTWGMAREVTAQVMVEARFRRQAEGQEAIADLGRLALKGEPLDELFDFAVGAAWRVLSSDCAWLVERVADTSAFLIRAEVGWPDEVIDEQIASEAGSLSGHAVRSREPIVVEDWEHERRFQRSHKRLAHGARSSVGVLVGDPNSPFGVLEVQFMQPHAVPSDCLPFLIALANVLAEAIQNRRAQEHIRHQALHDVLTGLPNRTLFLDRVAHALARIERGHQQLAVFFVDLDHFKLVNDSLGHEAGDELLRLVAPRLARTIRHGDTLARLSGDEFAVVCEELPSAFAATRVAGQLLRAFDEPFALRGGHRVVAASIGIALGNGKSSATDLLRDADAALYHAKRAGRGRFEMFDVEMRASVLDRVRTESALRTALASDEEIYVEYQPLVSLRSGRIVGAEALARWRHPDWGPVSPIEFIPVAEDSGLIHALGAKVFRRAAREAAAWQGNPDFAGVSVNVSARQLVEPGEVPALVREVVAAEGIAPGFLTLEITESMRIERLASAQDVVGSLKELGVRLALDDFGTGYSSLSYLRDLPFDSVKIDRSLIANIVDSSRGAELAAAIVHMGHALGLEVIAEGVETQAQIAVLRSLGCDIAKGFWFAKPMAPEQLTTFLRERPRWLPGQTRRPRAVSRGKRSATIN